MMQSLALALLLLNLFLLTLTFLNVFTVRKVNFRFKNTKLASIDEKVSILIPLRNESQNVDGLMSSVLNQSNLSDFEVIALDDNSIDQTLFKLQDFSASNLKILSGKDLPQGWLGKNFACHQLAGAASGEYLVFIDADVRLNPDAIAQSIHLMRKLHWEFISPYPRQIAISFLERLAQPLLQWSWFVSLPLRLAERLQKPSMIVANGQFLIIKKRAYINSGGHEVVKSEVLDDMELARALIRSGAQGGVADGSQVAECRMYSNSSELIEGYSKSQWRAFGSPVGALAVCALIFATSVLPFALGLSGNLFGWYGYFAIVLSRLLVAAKTKSVISSATLHPISALLWIYLIINSWVKKWQGSLTWRGRNL